MAKSIKDKNWCWDSTGISHNRRVLSELLNEFEELTKDSYTKGVASDAYFDVSKTNVAINKNGNVVTIGGVLYFNSIPPTWQEIIQIPENFYGSSGYGSIIEEQSGLVRPIVINDSGQIMMTASLSSSNIYAYINAIIIL